MSDSPRRSARLSQLHQQSSSQSSLSSSSSHSSAVSVAAYPSPTGGIVQQQDQFRLQFQAQFLSAPQHFNAPLPSPSTDDINPFFGHLGPQQNLFPMSQQSQSDIQHSASQSHQQFSQTASDQSQQQHQKAQQHNSIQQQQRPDMQSRNNGGQMPPDFLAEAARRAQIACLMRDMGDVTL